jgi:hypothetical protein
MIWTGDHLDAARRLQATLVGPARAVTELRALGPLDASGSATKSRDGEPAAH